MDVGAAQLVLRQLVPERPLDHRRAGGEERPLGRHHREVSQHGRGRGAARRRAGHRVDQRHLLAGQDGVAEGIEGARQMGVPLTPLIRDVGGRALDEVDQRHAVLPRHVLKKVVLRAILAAAGGGPPGDREVRPSHHDPAAVDLGQPAHVGHGRKPGEAPLLVRALARQAADLVEAAGVGERIDALPDRQFAQGVLPGDALLAAQLERQAAAQVDLIDLGLPGHRGSFRWGGGGRGVERKCADLLGAAGSMGDRPRLLSPLPPAGRAAGASARGCRE